MTCPRPIDWLAQYADDEPTSADSPVAQESMETFRFCRDTFQKSGTLLTRWTSTAWTAWTPTSRNALVALKECRLTSNPILFRFVHPRGVTHLSQPAHSTGQSVVGEHRECHRSARTRGADPR